MKTISFSLLIFLHILSFSQNIDYYQKALILFDKKNYNAAISNCDKFLSNHKDSIDVLLLKAKCYFYISKYTY